MSWIIERLANNLELITGTFDILSGARRIFFGVIILMFVVSCAGCSYSIHEKTDAVGDSTVTYSLLWAGNTSEAEPPPAPPRQHVSRRRAIREETQAEASPLNAKWYK